MRRRGAICICLVLTSAILFAESRNPADYPLRIHIFNQSQTEFYYHRTLDSSQGEGRANLFENGEVHAVDFSFNCSQKLKASFGYETYFAKWKKPNQELVVLLPVFGKSGAYFTCNLSTQVKDYAYLQHNGRMGSETPVEFKAWMVKHKYDPEHGMDVPTRTAPQTAADAPQ